MGERLTLDALLDHAGFRRRHLGLTDDDRAVMLSALGRPDLDTLVADVVPAAIRSDPAVIRAYLGTDDEAGDGEKDEEGFFHDACWCCDLCYATAM